MKRFTIFGITTVKERCFRVNEKYKAIREIDTYGDESLFLSRKVYTHKSDRDIRFRYQYAIESYTNSDEGQEKTQYTLYLVPVFNSLSEKNKKSVIDSTNNNPDTIDVFDYGCNIIMASECRDGGFNKEVIDNIANTVECIDSLRGFYLDKPQNRIGSTGWDMLYDFIKDVDYIEATFKRYENN